jgi:uncharacterized protein (TIGR02421 family)
MDEARRARALVSRLAEVLGDTKKKGYLLEQIAWPRSVEERFFAHGGTRLPEVEYVVDRDGNEAHIADLARERAAIDGDDVLAGWARRVLDSRIAESRLLLAVGTRAFTDVSRELYGGARTPFFVAPTSRAPTSGAEAHDGTPGARGLVVRAPPAPHHGTHLALADHLLHRIQTHGWDEASDPEETPLDAQAFGETVRAHVDRMRPRMDVEISIDPGCTAKVLAGMRRVRIRPDATFPRDEAEGLWHHEVETHALTAQNGHAQVEAPFLSSGGPRTTRTQEGLAVFSELYNRVLTTRRIERLALRVKLVDMAEQGASFLDVYGCLVDRGSSERDAYLDAQRICRGGLVEGGAPFTKDACYVAGLCHVYAFLNAFVRGGFRDETELLVCGRIDLEDIAALVHLRALGILSRPRHRPRWLRHWDTLLPYFAFSSFMQSVDLAPVEAQYRAAIELAASATPRGGPHGGGHEPHASDPDA